MFRLWPLNLVLDPRLGIRFNSAEPQLKIPATEQQRMIERGETKLSICASSTDRRGWWDKSRAEGLCVGLCGGGQKPLLNCLPHTICNYNEGRAWRSLWSPRFLFCSIFSCVCVWGVRGGCTSGVHIYMHEHVCGCLCTCVYACLYESVHAQMQMYNVWTPPLTLPRYSLKQSPAKPRVHQYD